MKTKTLLVLLLFLTLSACAPATVTPAPQLPFITATPTLFSGSSIPPLNTPAAGSATMTPVPTSQGSPAPYPSFTPLSQSAQPTPSPVTYAVILVAEDDVLNIRSGPGEEDVAGTLQPTDAGLVRTGKTSGAGEEAWLEIQNPGGGTGWVNAKFLTEEIAPAAFCSDARVTTLLKNVESAVKSANGEVFKTLVSPAHGLDLVYIRNGTLANYSPEEAGWAFQSTYEVDWGPGAGSGAPVTGTFPGVVLPALQNVFQNVTLVCNEIKLGGATYQVEWPAEYANINFYSLHNPGTSQNGNMDWRTWLAGVEYLNGQPYLFSLLNYQWEP